MIIPAHQYVRKKGLTALFDSDGERDKAGSKSAADYTLATNIIACLDYHYPGIIWTVVVRSEQGVCYIGVPDICSYVWLIKLTDLASDPGFKSVIRAGGDYLERFNIPRGDLKAAELIREFLDKNPLAYLKEPDSCRL